MKTYATTLTAILVLSGAVGAQAAGAPAVAKPVGQSKLVVPKGKVLGNQKLDQTEGKFVPILVGVGVSVAVGAVSRGLTDQRTTWKDVAADAAGGVVGGTVFKGVTAVGKYVYTTNNTLKNVAPYANTLISTVAGDTAKEVAKTRY